MSGALIETARTLRDMAERTIQPPGRPKPDSEMRAYSSVTMVAAVLNIVFCTQATNLHRSVMTTSSPGGRYYSMT